MGHQLNKLSPSDAKAWAEKKTGGGGTSPTCFVKSISTDKIVILTDGQVSEGEVVSCDSLMSSRKLSEVEVHFVNTGGSINLSVAAPFTRNATSFSLFRDGNLITNGRTDISIDLQKYYNQVPLFMDEADQLNTTIAMKNLGQTNLELRNSLLDLKSNLMNTLAKEKGLDLSSLRDTFSSGLDSAMSKCRTIIENLDRNKAKELEQIFDRLIHSCTAKDFSFKLLEPTRLTRAAPVSNSVPAEGIPDTICDFECPVSLDSDIPVLLIKKGEPILANCDKSLVESLMSNPLELLSNPALVAKVKDRLDHPIGVSAVKDLFERRLQSPLTRAPVGTCIAFGDHPTHYKATNYAMANLFFSGKLVGQPELWLAVIYFICCDLEYLSDLKPIFEASLMTRMKSRNTYLTLSGLALSPMVKAPVDIAVWSLGVISPRAKLGEDRLRQFGSTARHLVKLA